MRRLIVNSLALVGASVVSFAAALVVLERRAYDAEVALRRSWGEPI